MRYADCLMGHSFGSSTDEGSVNHQLAVQLVEHADGRPIIADRTLVEALPGLEELMAHIVEGQTTNMKLQGVGTKGTLESGADYMLRHDLHITAMFAQAFHITRTVKQSARLPIEVVVPSGLPTDFDKKSDQPWTRSPLLWIPSNYVGALLLKARGTFYADTKLAA